MADMRIEYDDRYGLYDLYIEREPFTYAEDELAFLARSLENVAKEIREIVEKKNISPHRSAPARATLVNK